MNKQNSIQISKVWVRFKFHSHYLILSSENKIANILLATSSNFDGENINTKPTISISTRSFFYWIIYLFS